MAVLVTTAGSLAPGRAYAVKAIPPGGGTPSGSTQQPTTLKTKYKCGSGDTATYTSVNIGCVGKGNAIMDALFGIINFLSDGVGVVIVASLIWAGIQFTASRGDPQSTATAIKRIRSNVLALFVFIFAYAILNYVVPGAVLR